MKLSNMRIIRASTEHLAKVSSLFNKYRIFYNQPNDLLTSTGFINDRIKNKDSVIFLAVDKSAGLDIELGFTQLFPSFTSVGVAKIFVLNDLYVEEVYRGQGVARALIQHASTFATNEGAIRLDLKTAFDNPAQNLYRSMGYVEDTKFIHFSIDLSSTNDRHYDSLKMINVSTLTTASSDIKSGNGTKTKTKSTTQGSADGQDSSTLSVYGAENDSIENEYFTNNKNSKALSSSRDYEDNQIFIEKSNNNYNETKSKFYLFDELLSWVFNLPTWLQNQILDSSPFKSIIENAKKAQDFIENTKSLFNSNNPTQDLDLIPSVSKEFTESDSLQKAKVSNSFVNNQVDLNLLMGEIPTAFQWQVQSSSNMPNLEFNDIVELFAG